MTLDQAKTVYCAAGGELSHYEEDWAHIQKEMEDVVSAKSDRAAGKTILCWDCWDGKYTATAFARRVRRAYYKVIR